MLLLSVPPPLVDETSNTPAACCLDPEIIFSRVGGEEGAGGVGVPIAKFLLGENIILRLTLNHVAIDYIIWVKLLQYNLACDGTFFELTQPP